MIRYLLQRARWLIGVINRYFGMLAVYVGIGLVSGTMVFLLVLNSAYGILPANMLFSKKESDKEAQKRIALLSSEYSHAVYEKLKGNHHAQVDLWATLLKASGAQVQIISDADLERGLNEKFQALVLPGSLALSEVEKDKVRRFVRSGHGLLIEGPVGTRDGDDRWRGWDFLKELVKANAIETLKSQDQERAFVKLTGGSPLSVKLPTGLKIKNNFYSENYGVYSDRPEAYWSEWLAPLAKQKPYAAAIKTNRYGAGRVVWFGFNLGSMSDEPEPRQAVTRLIENATDWITEQPLAQVATWPHAEPAAVNLTFDCESDFKNIANVLDRPEAESLRFTFFMLSSVAQRYPDLVKRAAQNGEIAIHGDDHTIFAGQAYDVQVQRLFRAQSVLETLVKDKVASFRPPEQKSDTTTLAALKKLGLRALFSDYIGISSPRLETGVKAGSSFLLPFTLTQSHPIVRIPRPAYDDYDLFARQQLDARQAGELMLEDMNRIIGEGGLYVLSMHTTAPWGGLNPDKMPALTALLSKLQDGRLWITTVKEAADWWEKRSLIKVNVTKYSQSVILLQVTNLNNQTMENLPIEVYLPQSHAQIEIQSSKVEFQAPRWELKEGGKVIVRIPSIKEGESKSYVITNGKRAE